MFSLKVKLESKFSSTSLKSLLKYCSLQMASTPGSLVEIVRSVMIYILILTTTLFVLYAIETTYYIISSSVFGSQRNISHGNSRTIFRLIATLSASQTNKSVTGDVSVGGWRGSCHKRPQMVLLRKVTFRERVELTDATALPFFAECRLRLISQILLSLSASFKCSSHMSVPIRY